jgi:hypothetical protein
MIRAAPLWLFMCTFVYNPVAAGQYWAGTAEMVMLHGFCQYGHGLTSCAVIPLLAGVLAVHSKRQNPVLYCWLVQWWCVQSVVE